MKTKEIEVYVHEGFENWDDDSCLIHSNVYNKKHTNYTVKAKLIIEIPEKKIEITESDFERIVKEYAVIDDGSNVWRDLKKDLGFKDD